MEGSDPLDHASDMEMRQRERAIHEVQSRLVESHPDFDGKHCVECASKLPDLRLSMGRIRCTLCQEVRERKMKHFGG